MAPTTKNLTEFHTAWDAAVAAYDLVRGANGADDMMFTGVDMTSVDTTGLWTLVGGAVPDRTPNSNVPVFWTDGTDVIGPLSFDDLSNEGKVQTLLDGYFGPRFKVWFLLDSIISCIEADSLVGSSVIGDLSAVTQEDLITLVTCLEGRFSYCTSNYGLVLPGTMG